jgi:tripartite-type tricarboxylate transporter receptor subunit TctC
MTVSDTFQGLFAPAARRSRRSIAWSAVQAILARPDIQDRYAKSGLPVVAEPPEVFRARVAREVPMYKDIIDKAGLKIQ